MYANVARLIAAHFFKPIYNICGFPSMGYPTAGWFISWKLPI